jgi:hypothetical protein
MSACDPSAESATVRSRTHDRQQGVVSGRRTKYKVRRALFGLLCVRGRPRLYSARRNSYFVLSTMWQDFVLSAKYAVLSTTLSALRTVREKAFARLGADS